MSITGFLSDFSLPEIFRFIDQGNKSGLLMLRSRSESGAASSYYIWVENGQFVAAANRLNNQGLLSLIQQYEWVSNRVITKLAQLCPEDQPLGLYLRHQGALRGEQLEHLFQVQVIQQLCLVCQLTDAQFRFDQNVPIPTREMTGLQLPASIIEVLLQKLVVLKQLFAARNLRYRGNGNRLSENFCQQLGLTMDITFFHCLKLSLFDTNYTLADLAKIVDIYYRPYDIPKSKFSAAKALI
ncbi:DUF4388 domain-containing protein [Coleofasciculus sp.]|uniref:DUF4388 domain-containing protein n=1 Tax=Coleofasciculus sp. TaxID=3100458 RepID=UPI0039FA610D